MNTFTAKELAKFYNEVAEVGRPIEIYSSHHARWTDTTCGPQLSDEISRYRIQPVPPLECWVNRYTDGFLTAHATKENALRCLKSNEARVAVHMKEVVEND